MWSHVICKCRDNAFSAGSSPESGSEWEGFHDISRLSDPDRWHLESGLIWICRVGIRIGSTNLHKGGPKWALKISIISKSLCLKTVFLEGWMTYFSLKVLNGGLNSNLDKKCKYKKWKIFKMLVMIKSLSRFGSVLTLRDGSVLIPIRICCWVPNN